MYIAYEMDKCATLQINYSNSILKLNIYQKKDIKSMTTLTIKNYKH